MRFKDFATEADFLSEVESFAQSYVKNHAGEIDAQEEFPCDFVTQVAARRLFMLEKLSDSSPCLDSESSCKLILKAVEMLARVSASAAKMVLDQNFGQVGLFMEHAAQELQSKYIPKIRAGESQMALLVTEPQTGSLLSRFRCIARKVNGGFSINGSKDWIT